MKIVFALVAVFGAAVLFLLLGEPQHEDTLIARFALDEEAGLMRSPTRDADAIDPEVGRDGDGSLRIESTGEHLVDLYRVWGDEQDLSASAGSSTGPTFGRREWKATSTS